MAESVILYSQVVPTILAVIGVYFIGSGVLDDNKAFLGLGLLLFALAVIVPFVILSIII